MLEGCYALVRDLLKMYMDGGEPWNLCSGCDHVAVGFLELLQLMFQSLGG
jgi:hypothetical protein